MKTTTFYKSLFVIVGLIAVVNLAFAQLSVSLTISTYGPFNVSCFGGTNGWINSTPSGGTAPYTYQWSNGATTQNLSNIPVSYYQVTVTDFNGATATRGVTLREPTGLSVILTSPTYPNGYNVSCYQCFNGSITNTPSGGVSPYTYAWPGGVFTQNRSSIGGGSYTVVVTDANGCTKMGVILVSEPARDDWTMLGNTGSNPPTQYIGTADNKDLVFKTNATERIRVASNGNVGIGTNNPLATLDVNGSAKIGGNLTVTSINSTDLVATSNPCLNVVGTDAYGHLTIIDIQTCSQSPMSLWTTIGNTLPDNTSQFIGTMNNYDFRIKTNNAERMIVTADGKVGIGTSTPQSLLDINHNINNGVNRFSVGTADGSGLSYGTSYIGFNAVRTSSGWVTKSDGSHNGGNVIYGDINGDLRFVNIDNSSSSTADQTNSDVDILGKTKMIITGDGRVAIGGIDHPSYQLAVHGNIIARDVMVKLEPWPDYVFNSDYKLPSLSDVKEFISNNNHLPGLPSANEIASKDIGLSTIVTAQTQKIEELTLYLLQLKEEIESLQKENTEIKSQLNK